MDPIPQMVIETTAATKKGRIEVTLDGIAGLRAQLDKAERGLLAAKAAMGAAAEDEQDDGEDWPAPCPACGQRDEHANGCERDAQLTAIGEHVQALSEPARPGVPAKCLDKYEHLGNVDYCQRDKGHDGQHAGHMNRRWTPAGLVPLDESLPWATAPAGACGWSGPDGEHCLLKPHGPKVMHAAPIGAGSMRRWPALRSVTA